MLRKILPFLPETPTNSYCEPYCGASAIFFAKEAAQVEILNDLDGGIINLFRCLQDPEKYKLLEHRILHTLYSRSEFQKAIAIIYHGAEPQDEISRAWAKYVVMNMGYAGRQPYTVGNWSRAFKKTSGMGDVNNTWLMRLSMLPDWHKRLLRAQIDNRPALECIQYWDNLGETTFYVDPPYPESTRKGKAYTFDMVEEDHVDLMKVLDTVRGPVIMSGYYVPAIHDEYLDKNWKRISWETAAYSSRGRGTGVMGTGEALRVCPRTEVLFLNEYAQSRLSTEARSRLL